MNYVNKRENTHIILYYIILYYIILLLYIYIYKYKTM